MGRLVRACSYLEDGDEAAAAPSPSLCARGDVAAASLHQPPDRHSQRTGGGQGRRRTEEKEKENEKEKEDEEA